MNKLIRNLLKKPVLAILPDSEKLRSLVHRPMYETWLKKHAVGIPVFDKRFEMYDYLVGEVIGGGELRFLEFGVFQGESIKHFASIDANAGSQFVGFDTFTGLPEDWVEMNRTVERAGFDVGGEIPKCDDSRVSFQKGMFQETLPGFLAEYGAADQLILHCDADLYSSTLYVLTQAHDVIVDGTIIIFDEFYSVMHEFRALEDYCSAYMRSYEVIAATPNCDQVAIRMC